MAAIGYLESLLNTLPAEVRRVLAAYTREAFGQLRFGAPATSAAPCENLGGHLVPYTTSSTANREVAVEHKLGRVPRLALQAFALNTVNATSPVLTITRAADMTFVYIKSATTNASGHLYVE
jgi:uncharacterized caspase-like protein